MKNLWVAPGWLLAALASLLLVNPCWGKTSDYYGRMIVDLKIEGNVVIETSTIKYRLISKVGELLSADAIQQDIRSIFASGYFEDIVVDAEQAPEGVIVIYRLVEKPILKSYEITGNKKLTNSTLNETIAEKKIDLKVPSVYDPVKINQAAQVIRDKYIEEGFSYVTVTPLTKQVSAKEITVTLAVNEGDKVRIRSIVFKGNDALNSGTRYWGLKHALKPTREHWWMSWLTGGGKFTQEKLDEAVDNLLLYYYDKGFANASIAEPEISIEEKRFGKKKQKSRKLVDIVVPIHEGTIYRFGDLAVEGNELFESKNLLGMLSHLKTDKMFDSGSVFKGDKNLRTGQRYNGSLVKKAIEGLTELYGSHGYIYVNVYPETAIDEEKKQANIVFKIREGEQTRLHTLEFKGNNRTRDKVLRREMRLAEGDIFNTVSFKNGIARISYLGYIKDIVPDVQPLPEDPTKINAVISVNDEHQTEIQLSGGYSSADKVFGMLSLSEHNLFGRGQELNFSVNTSRLRRTFQIRFSDDYLFDTNNYGSFSIWNTYKSYPSAKYKTIGGNIFTGRPIYRDIFGRLGYSYQIDRVYELDDDDDADEEDPWSEWRDWEDPEREYLAEQEGKTRTSAITQYFARDRRDNRREATRGTHVTLTLEIAGGILQGDNDFYRVELQGSWYKTLGRKIVWVNHFELDYADGYGGKDLPYFKRYFLGGAMSVRGYGQNTIGPKTSEGVNFGGNKAFIFNSELVIPIAGPLKTVIFFDAGDAYRERASIDLKTLRPSIGAELRFYVPAFWLPIRFIWGYKLDRYEDESLTDFQFTIGTFF